MPEESEGEACKGGVWEEQGLLSRVHCKEQEFATWRRRTLRVILTLLQMGHTFPQWGTSCIQDGTTCKFIHLRCPLNDKSKWRKLKQPLRIGCSSFQLENSSHSGNRNTTSGNVKQTASQSSKDWHSGQVNGNVNSMCSVSKKPNSILRHY